MDNIFFQEMLKISKEMAETRVLDPLLRYAIDVAMRLVNAERGYLILRDAIGQLEFRVKLDRYGHELESPEGQISRSMLNRVIENAEPLVVTDALVDPNFSTASSVNALQLRSVMCVPLISRGEPIGVIYVENRSNANIFEKESIEPLAFFASQAAVSIENAMLNDELEARVAARTAELEEAKTQVEQSFMEIVEANRIRTMFLSNVAHDIRSPLNMVVGSLSLIQEGAFGPVTEDQKEWIDRSLNTIHHIVRLTDDFFDLTKIEMGRMVLFRDKVDTAQFLTGLYKIGESLPWQEGVTFNLDLDTGLPSIVLDVTRIQQVVLNLLTNASKFTESGTVTLYARCADRNAIVIGVRDTGAGIPEDQMELIFDRFQQVKMGNGRARGTGLGLSICRELVQLHNGRIWVESSIGQGSDFKFTLPTETQ